MPADHSGGLDDQHLAPEPRPVEGTREHGQDCPVRRSEPGPIDLSVQNVQLMAKSKDFGITLVTGHQEQPETSDQAPQQVRKDR